MPAKVLQINMRLVCDENASNGKMNTNVLKSVLKGLLNMGKTCNVISTTLKPVPVKSDIELFLAKKVSFKFYDSEMIILSKGDKFPDGETFTINSLEKRLRDAVPALCDKKTGDSYNISVLKINIKKL